MNDLVIWVSILIVAVVGCRWLLLWVNANSILSAFKSMSKAFNSEINLNESTIKLIYNSLVEDVKISYVKFVSDYRIYLLKDNDHEVKNYNKIVSLLDDIIAREHSLAPFSELDPDDRKTMIALESAFKDKDSLPLVQQNLEDLSNSLSKYKKAIEKKGKQSKWSFIITIVSLLFALFAFIWGNRVSKQDYNRIDGRLSCIINRLNTLSQSYNETAIDDIIAPEEESRQ